MSEYNAASIRILKPAEACEKFEWLKANKLAQQYAVPLAFVERGIKASIQLNMPLDYFIKRYLEGLRDIPMNFEFNEVYGQPLLMSFIVF